MSPETLTLVDYEPAQSSFLDAVIAGLGKTQKTLPTAFLYDEHGSALFDQICELPEYYPTRTELAIMDRAVSEMAQALGPEVELVEYGSGSSLKTRALLAALADPVAYVPVDISREHLLRSARALAVRFSQLEVIPVCADFTQPFEIPTPAREAKRRAIYFPGSTIGNFRPDGARRLLAQMAGEVGSGGAVLLGVDLIKPVERLERAYDDEAGVTAAFNLNLLRRINRELGADFDLDGFEHRAPFVEERQAIEMRLVSKKDQTVHVGGRSFAFESGEWIHTEDSHKYTLEGFARLAKQAGLVVERVWTDPEPLFSVQYLRVE